jgi:tetratricopeptide (TPR) repeat protein
MVSILLLRRFERKFEDMCFIRSASSVRDGGNRTPYFQSHMVAFGLMLLCAFTTIICAQGPHDSFQAGIEMLNAGLKHAAKTSTLYLSRGVLYVQMAQWDNAEADFKMAEQLDSSQGIVAYADDLSILQKNDPDKALARVRIQLKEHPDNALLHLLLAQLIMNQTPESDSPAFKEAMQEATIAIKLKPDLVEAHNQLASMYMSLGQYDNAVKECRIALQYDAANEAAMYHLIISLRHSGKNAELPPLVKRLAEMHQDSLKRETDRKRFRLVVEGSPMPEPAGTH